jgi:hypothetical protein
MEQQISELTESERAWLADQLRATTAFVERFSPEDAGQEHCPLWTVLLRLGLRLIRPT